MPLHPPPTIAASLGLVVQKLQRTDMSRAAEVTFGLTVSGTPSLAVAQDAIDDFQVNFNATLRNLLDTQVVCAPPTIRLGDGSNVPFEAVAAGAAANGLDANTFVPPNVAFLFKKTTGVGGRKSRGRMYLPFALATSDVSENGTIAGAAVSGGTTQSTAFLTQLATDTTQMVIVNKTFDTSGPKPFVTAITIGPTVLTFAAEATVATQRRRLGR